MHAKHLNHYLNLAICNSSIEESINEREDYNLKEIYCLDCHNQYFKKHGESPYDDERNSNEKLVSTTQSVISSCCINTHFYLDNSPKGDEDNKIPSKEKSSDLLNDTMSTNLIYKKKSLQTLPIQNFAKESITNVITGADSY